MGQGKKNSKHAIYMSTSLRFCSFQSTNQDAWRGRRGGVFARVGRAFWCHRVSSLKENSLPKNAFSWVPFSFFLFLIPLMVYC